MGLTDYAKRAKEQGRVWWSDSWIERQLAEREVRRPTPPPSRTKWTRLVHPSVLIGHARPAGDASLAPDARLV